jgi:ankyrin repeat protein
LSCLLTQVVIGQDQGVQLRRAVLAGDDPLITKLASSKAAINSTNSDGVTALMIAAGLGRTAVAKSLLTSGADVNAKSIEGVTALMLAADFGHVETVQLLVDRGAALNEKDKAGFSAMDYAVIPNKGESPGENERTLTVAKYLKSKGGEQTDNSTKASGLGLLLTLTTRDLKVLLEKAKAEQP